jgi:hypothetical protein
MRWAQAKEVPAGGTFLCLGWPPTRLVRVEPANFFLPVVLPVGASPRLNHVFGVGGTQLYAVHPDWPVLIMEGGDGGQQQ